MDSRPLRILQVNTRARIGGAARVARSLFRAYWERGHESWFAVGFESSGDPDILVLPRVPGSLWSKACLKFAARLRSLRGLRRINRIAGVLANPQSWIDLRRGIEDFHFPGTSCLLTLPPRVPDIIHCHNLHGDYFDLRVLTWLSRRLPVALTLHDAWLLTGHCAHSFECERWKLGCGKCPDLTIYPGIRRDATAYNFRRKREIFARSRLYLATPSRWLMDRVMQSMLVPAIADIRVIPNGVDLSIFRPADRRAARAAVGIPQDAKVVLIVADGIRRNPFKDYHMLRAALGRIGGEVDNEWEVLAVALGEDAPAERIGRVQIRFVPYQEDPVTVAKFYQAADLYVHAASADTFPNAVVEALACGTPVVATAVGGIPEQVTSMIPGVAATGGNPSDGRKATGALVKPGDAASMAMRIEHLLTDQPLRDGLAQNASRDARNRFDFRQQVSTYLHWYESILRDFRDEHGIRPVVIANETAFTAVMPQSNVTMRKKKGA